MTTSRILLVLLGVLWTSTCTQAAFVTPQSWTRGEGGTTYQHWDVLDTYSTDNTPDVGNINLNGTASLTENSGMAFLTGGGNFYSPSAALDFTVTIPEADVPSPQHNVTAVVQIKSLGTELDYGSVLLNGISPISTSELSRESLGGFGGDSVESWFLFNVPYADFANGDGVSDNLSLTFNAMGAHMSFDQLAIDTAVRPFGYYAEPTPAAVPEPSTMAILGVCMGGLLVSAKRRQKGLIIA